MSISILCPTRGRPKNMLRVSKELLEKSMTETEIIFYIDNDDTDSLLALPNLVTKYPNRVKALISTRINQSDTVNHLYPLVKHDIMFLIGDDILCHNHAWDITVSDIYAKSNDKILLVYGRDGINDQNLSTHMFLHRNWVDTLGYITPNCFTADYADCWLFDIACKINRQVYVPSLYFEHLHPNVGKAEIDQTHKDRLNKTYFGNNRELYFSLKEERINHSNKLLEKIIKYETIRPIIN